MRPPDTVTARCILHFVSRKESLCKSIGSVHIDLCGTLVNVTVSGANGREL